MKKAFAAFLFSISLCRSDLYSEQRWAGRFVPFLGLGLGLLWQGLAANTPAEASVAAPALAFSAQENHPKPSTAANSLDQVKFPARGNMLLGAEERLIDVYRLIIQGNSSVALREAQSLAKEYPNFQLAQLVLGDLLLAQAGKTDQFGAVAKSDLLVIRKKRWAQRLESLRVESKKRLQASFRPPLAGQIPKEFVLLASNVRHAIAVDATLSRLYLFEQNENGFHLLNDFYMSVGKGGVDKVKEGDNRTPSGLYYVNARIDKKDLTDFYGAGALPIDYPNALDLSLGRTGSGIWLHGSPSRQFAREPLASAGCIVLANPDMETLLQTVDLKNTPVIVSKHLEWSFGARLSAENRSWMQNLVQWAQALSNGDLKQLEQFYVKQPESVWQRMRKAQGKKLSLKNISLLRWEEGTPYAILSFDLFSDETGGYREELRQYWLQDGKQWRILSERTL